MPLAVSLPAQAETIFLKCGDGTLSIDMTNHTVDGKPANITPLQIDWHNVNQYGDVHVVIDRTAGTMTTSGTYFRPEGNVPIPCIAPVSCSVVDQPATKF